MNSPEPISPDANHRRDPLTVKLGTDVVRASQQYVDFMKSVSLRPIGETPTWDPKGNHHAWVDPTIVAAHEGGDLTVQKKLYQDLAVHLHRNRFPENGGHEADHSDDAEWLRRLAIYFGWSDELHSRVDREAVHEAYKVLPSAEYPEESE